jgi:hypothetical protein
MLDAMWGRAPLEIPADLRARLETARLDLLALVRALDRMRLTLEQIPQRFSRQLFELDADYVEALWGLDRPPAKLNLRAMLCDAAAALDQLPAASSRFLRNLPPQAQSTLAQRERVASLETRAARARGQGVYRPWQDAGGGKPGRRTGTEDRPPSHGKRFLRRCLQYAEEQRRLQALTTRGSSIRTWRKK